MERWSGPAPEITEQEIDPPPDHRVRLQLRRDRGIQTLEEVDA
jgi:hypothetical protein